MKQETKKKIAIIGITAVLGICAVAGVTNTLTETKQNKAGTYETVNATLSARTSVEEPEVIVLGNAKHFKQQITIEETTYTLTEVMDEVYTWMDERQNFVAAQNITIGQVIEEGYEPQNYIYYAVGSNTQLIGRYTEANETIKTNDKVAITGIIYNPQEQEPPEPTTNNITEGLYNLIWNTFFSGTLPEGVQNCAQEICTVMTIAGICLVIALPLIVMFGLIKWIWNFVR